MVGILVGGGPHRNRLPGHKMLIGGGRVRHHRNEKLAHGGAATFFFRSCGRGGGRNRKTRAPGGGAANHTRGGGGLGWAGYALLGATPRTQSNVAGFRLNSRGRRAGWGGGGAGIFPEGGLNPKAAPISGGGRVLKFSGGGSKSFPRGGGLGLVFVPGGPGGGAGAPSCCFAQFGQTSLGAQSPWGCSPNPRCSFGYGANLRLVRGGTPWAPPRPGLDGKPRRLCRRGFGPGHPGGRNIFFFY